MGNLSIYGKRITLGLLIFQNISGLWAASVSNCAEMGLALATIPFDIAAQKNDLGNNPRKAAMLHLVTDLLSLANKSCFFYNNIAAQQAHGSWTFRSRDMLVNGTLAALDLKDLGKHFKQFIASRKNKQKQNIIADLDDELDQEQISQLAYSWKVFALPCLKGLSAFALACTQEGVTGYANQHARNLATAAHSFTKLLAEYNSLETNSGYTTLLSAALMVNATWLVYEVKNYKNYLTTQQNQNAPYVFMQKHQGQCNVCYGDEQLDQLHCGHGYCRNCLIQYVQTKYGERGVTPFNTMRCPHYACQEVINRNELREIVNDDPIILAAYDAPPENVRPLTQDEIDALIRAGARPCPGQGCGTPIQRDGGCQHMTCRRCRHEFCWICMGPYYPGGPCTSFRCRTQP